MGKFSIKKEIEKRRSSSNTLDEWKEDFNWAVFWLNNFITAANDLENLFINEVGIERYSEILYQYNLSRGNLFINTSFPKIYHNIPESNSNDTNEKLTSNVIPFPKKY